MVFSLIKCSFLLVFISCIILVECSGARIITNGVSNSIQSIKKNNETIIKTSNRENAIKLLESLKLKKKSTEVKTINNTTNAKSNASDIFTRLDANNRRVLTYYGLMLAGAVARSAASTAVHPLNVMKTTLQTKHGRLIYCIIILYFY